MFQGTLVTKLRWPCRLHLLNRTVALQLHMRLTFWTSTSSMPPRMATGRTGISNLDPSGCPSSLQRHATFSIELALSFGIRRLAPKFLTVTPPVVSWSLLPLPVFFLFLGGLLETSSSTKTRSLVGVTVASFFLMAWCEIRIFTWLGLMHFGMEVCRTLTETHDITTVWTWHDVYCNIWKSKKSYQCLEISMADQLEVPQANYGS